MTSVAVLDAESRSLRLGLWVLQPCWRPGSELHACFVRGQRAYMGAAYGFSVKDCVCLVVDSQVMLMQNAMRTIRQVSTEPPSQHMRPAAHREPCSRLPAQLSVQVSEVPQIRKNSAGSLLLACGEEQACAQSQRRLS